MHRKFIGSSAIAFLIVYLFSLPAVGQHQVSHENAESVMPLSPGLPVTRELAPQQRHRYKIDLKAGELVKIEVVEKGCVVVMSLRSPEGTNLLEFAKGDVVDGVETVWAAVSESAVYELRVFSYGKAAGTYTLRIGEIRPATQRELNLTAGIKLYNEAFNAANISLHTAEMLQVNLAKGQQALEKFRSAHSARLEAQTLWQTASLSFKLGITPRVLQLYHQSIAKFRSINDRSGEAKVLKDLGNAYRSTGEWDKAHGCYLESLKIVREIKDGHKEAVILNLLGDLYAYFGDAERAAIYYNQGLELHDRTVNGSRSLSLDKLGKISLIAGNNEKALEYFLQAIDAIRKENYRFGATRPDEATFLNNAGRTYFLLGRRDKAIEAFNEALRISRETADRSGEAEALTFLAHIYLDANETDIARKLAGQALEIYRATEDKQNTAVALLLLAKVNVKSKNLELAQTQAEEAIAHIEAVRTSVKPSDLRDAFTANLQDFYSFYIELLMMRHKREPNRKFAELAFQSSERARARGLLNRLNESYANVREGVDSKLLAKETSLKNLLSARMENLTKNLGGQIADEQVDKLKRETEQIRAEYEQLQAQIRQTSPRYAALTQPKIPDIQEIQKDLLDPDTVLLEYSLGEKKSFLWVVAKTDFQAFTLPAKSEIEKLTRSFYASLTARKQHVRFETVDERDERIRQADSEMERSSQELSSMLVAPAARQLADKRLLIVADGVLQYVPFSALTTADGQSPAKKRFLVETNEVVNLPSASVLSLLRNETQGRAAAPETVAIFADPIFDAEDTRLIKASRRTKLSTDRMAAAFLPAADKQTAANPSKRRGIDFERLPFTRREAEAISSLVPSDESKTMLDFAANRVSATAPELSNYRIVHFATHGFIDDRHPELDAIVLSLFDERGKPQDGFLRVRDVYNLNLPAELVVLSGCRTGLGKEIRGEGIVGLTRGFMYAGAKRVAVSLWDVDDEATADLMAIFYRGMLGERKLSAAAALRQAQIAILKGGAWSNPYYWSAFTLQGEPN